MSDYCNLCGVTWAGVTHICPPPAYSIGTNPDDGGRLAGSIQTHDDPYRGTRQTAPDTTATAGQTAWEEWRRTHYISPEVDSPALRDAFALGFRAGAVQALTDAADRMHSELGVYSDGGDADDTYQMGYGHGRDEAADWLRVRAEQLQDNE